MNLSNGISSVSAKEHPGSYIFIPRSYKHSLFESHPSLFVSIVLLCVYMSMSIIKRNTLKE